MVNTAEFKKYIGNAALYLDFDKSRQRTFLRRNITEALDRHHRALAADESDFNSSMRTDATEAWGFPKRPILDTLAAINKPALRIDVKNLLPKNRKKPDGESGPTKKKTKLFTVDCYLTFKIYANVGKDLKESVLVDSRRATLQAYRNEHGDKIFTVSMDEPLLIKSEKLEIDMARGNGYRRSMDKSYLLAINLSFPKREDMDVVVPILNNKKNNLPANLGKISGKYRRFVECLPMENCLPLNLTSAGRNYALEYEMEVEMGWETSEETTLQRYNRSVRCARTTHLPSPISEPRSSEKTVHLTYMFKDQPRSKSLALEGCLCLFCNRRDYNSLERLQHHFKTEHDMFIFKLVRKEKQSQGCTMLEVSIEVDISDRYSDLRASNNVADPHEINWVAPSKPFNLTEYLEGNESWISAGLGVKRKHHHFAKRTTLPQGAVQPKKPSEVQDMPRIERKKYKVPKAPKGLRFFRTDSKRPLEENEYLSESDDSISEDWLKLRRNQTTKDAETTIPAKAFMMKFDDYIQDEQLSGDIHAGDAIVRFARKYRTWLKTRPVMGNEFMKKASELHSDNIICEAVFEACIDLIHGEGSAIDAVPGRVTRHRLTPSSGSEPSGASPESPNVRRRYVPGGPGGGGRYVQVEGDGRRKGANGKRTTSPDSSASSSKQRAEGSRVAREPDGDAAMAADGGQENSTKPPLQEERAQEPSVAIQSGCICGKVVDDDRTAISCADLDCRRQEFHLACVGLTRRTTGWTCPDCRPR